MLGILSAYLVVKLVKVLHLDVLRALHSLDSIQRQFSHLGLPVYIFKFVFTHHFLDELASYLLHLWVLFGKVWKLVDWQSVRLDFEFTCESVQSQEVVFDGTCEEGCWVVVLVVVWCGEETEVLVQVDVFVVLHVVLDLLEALEVKLVQEGAYIFASEAQIEDGIVLCRGEWNDWVIFTLLNLLGIVKSTVRDVS